MMNFDLLFISEQIIHLLNMESRFPTRQGALFKYDVYLGFGAYDLAKMNSLMEKLEQNNVLFYPKYDAANLTKSAKTAIVEGVSRSKKCLLYVSDAFIKDMWATFEVAEVLHKAKRFSRDMVIVLKDSKMAEANMPCDLKEYISTSCAVHDDSTLKNPEFLRKLTTSLKLGTCLCIIGFIENLTYSMCGKNIMV